MNTPQKHSNIEHCYFLLTLAFISKLRNNFDNMLMYALRSRMYMRTDVVFIFIGDYLKATEQRNRKNRYRNKNRNRIIDNYERAIPNSSAAIIKKIKYNISIKNYDVSYIINYCNEILSRNEHRYYIIQTNILLGDFINANANSSIIQTSIYFTECNIISRNYPLRIKSHKEYYSDAVNYYADNNIKIKNRNTIRVLDYLINNHINEVENCCIGLKSEDSDYYSKRWNYLKLLSDYYTMRWDFIMCYIFSLIGAKNGITHGLFDLIDIYKNTHNSYYSRYQDILKDVEIVNKIYLNDTILREFSEEHDYILEHFSILREPNEKKRLSRIFLNIFNYANQIKDKLLFSDIKHLYREIQSMYKINEIKLFQQY